MTPLIKAALEEIEANRPAGEAKVRFDIYGGGVDESFIRGTRAGLVATGLLLIRAGFQQDTKKSPNGGAATCESLDHVLHEDSNIKFDWIEISDQLAGEPQIVAQSRAALKKEGKMIGFWIAVAVVLVIAIWLALHFAK